MSDLIFALSKKGEAVQLKQAIASHPEAVTDTSPRTGESALHMACARGHEACGLLLIQAGVPVDGVTARGLTPLHCAVVGGHTGCIKMLLSQGADAGLKFTGPKGFVGNALDWMAKNNAAARDMAGRSGDGAAPASRAEQPPAATPREQPPAAAPNQKPPGAWPDEKKRQVACRCSQCNIKLRVTVPDRSLEILATTCCPKCKTALKIRVPPLCESEGDFVSGDPRVTSDAAPALPARAVLVACALGSLIFIIFQGGVQDCLGQRPTRSSEQHSPRLCVLLVQLCKRV